MYGEICGCGLRFKRAYIRKQRWKHESGDKQKWVPIGWYCPKCNQLKVVSFLPKQDLLFYNKNYVAESNGGVYG